MVTRFRRFLNPRRCTRALVSFIHNRHYSSNKPYPLPAITKQQQGNLTNVVHLLKMYLGASEEQAKYLFLKHPSIRYLTKDDIDKYTRCLYEIGFQKDVLINNPALFAAHPITIQYRHQVLTECGFQDITVPLLTSFLTILKNKTVKELKRTGKITSNINIENHIARHMSQWPTSLTTNIDGDSETKTLYELRMSIIQRYFEMVLDMNEADFLRGSVTYPTIKHRPVAVISETIKLLQTLFSLPNNKIKSNFYLTHADPENLKKLLYLVKSIGGVDIREVIRMFPKIAMKNYEALMEIRTLLNSFGVSEEAQVRCLEIYTLGPITVKERIAKAYQIPEFKVYIEHPRFLKMIYYNKTAMTRLKKLYDKNKKCVSLHILSGDSSKYTSFEKSPGDRSGKGKDLIFSLCQNFGKDYSPKDIRKLIERHPFWINVPIVQVNYVFMKLSTKFSKQDIFNNCPILLYPWKKINEVLAQVKPSKNNPLVFQENIVCSTLTNSQILSLALYLLEKQHHFSGNGVWVDERKINVESLPNISVI